MDITMLSTDFIGNGPGQYQDKVRFVDAQGAARPAVIGPLYRCGCGAALWERGYAARLPCAPPATCIAASNPAPDTAQPGCEP